MSDRTFPVLWPGDRKHKTALEALGCPRTVPWAFIAEHADACARNHDQSPEVLASRGGLAPNEILAVIEPDAATYRVREALWRLPPEQSVPALKEALLAWEKAC